MTLNPFEMNRDGTSLCDIVLSSTSPWYADLWHRNGAFYQLKLKSAYSMGRQVIAKLYLNYLTKLKHTSLNAYKGSILDGKWWDSTSYEDNELRLLRAYNDNIPLERGIDEFHRKVADRFENSYYFKTMRVHPDYWSLVKTAIAKANLNIGRVRHE
jgi:hypothetical protein